VVNVHDPFEEAVITLLGNECSYPVPRLFKALMPPLKMTVKTEYFEVINIKAEFGILAVGEAVAGMSLLGRSPPQAPLAVSLNHHGLRQHVESFD
jgi:hypothetical protein